MHRTVGTLTIVLVVGIAVGMVGNMDLGFPQSNSDLTKEENRHEQTLRGTASCPAGCVRHP